ncbi:hypothetical protein Pcinc_034532 [Petrolisthes cinctipes]|uniref:G-protein coupled receptors family 1 profile domain-containing protein n=1 Tax=Petrolisthes cinctipes TaxID=88211 RepID=A0AAE1EQ29_PETCI|nr:hypothetical protein Pcinc_034532 [Petrolisthes cinctipes]
MSPPPPRALAQTLPELMVPSMAPEDPPVHLLHNYSLFPYEVTTGIQGLMTNLTNCTDSGGGGDYSLNCSVTNPHHQHHHLQHNNGHHEITRNYWTLLLLLFPVFTVFGNILVLMSVYRERSLQTVTNYFIVSLAVADLLLASIVMPFAVYFLVSTDDGFRYSRVGRDKSLL